jgi:peptide/nickel transport system substrate-binding protein
LTYAAADDKLTFERFDDYTGPRPAQAAGMNWNLLSDPAARVTAMRSGTIHAMEDVPYIDAPALANEVDVESVQSFGVLFMMFNTQKKPFDDVRVRQAFFYALDMDKIIENGLLGNAAPAKGFLQETHPNFHEASTVYTYDPEKAKELLAEAGVENLDITLLTTDTGWVADVAPLIKEDLDAIGVNTTLDIGQSAAQYGKVDNGDLDVMVAPGDPSVFGNDPDILMRWWYGDNVWSQTRYQWSDTPEFAELQELLDAGARAADEAERQEAWNSAFDLLSEQVPLYPLLHRQLPTAWDSERLSGFKPVPLTGLSFLDVGVVDQ